MKQRPVYLDLPRIRLPLPGIVSILHRLSGALLFLAGIPLLLYGVSRPASRRPKRTRTMKASFAHPRREARARSASSGPTCITSAPGIRYLLLDIHRGIELAPARRSSAVVLVLSLALTLILGARLW